MNQRGRRKPGEGDGRPWPVLLLALLVLLALLGPGRRPPQPPPHRLVQVLAGFAWPEYDRRAAFHAPWQLAEIEALLGGGERRETSLDHRFAYWTILLHFSDGSAMDLILSRDHSIFDPGRAAGWDHPRLQAHLARLTAALARQVFGEELPWPEVDRLFRRGVEAVVEDLETGLTFKVRRWAGGAHADVEPLTAADAETLRSIYGGTWSWRRRAVVVIVDGRRIAGSMNGMPHGEGAIRHNGFPGHFCLHFAGSRVHRTWRVDRGHQLMVTRAGGCLAEMLDAASPADLVAWVLTALNHRDHTTFRYAGSSLSGCLWADLTGTIRRLDVIAVRAGEATATAAGVEAEVLIYYREPDPDRPHRFLLTVPLRRNHPEEGWRADLESLRPLLVIPASSPSAPPLPEPDCGCEPGSHSS